MIWKHLLERGREAREGERERIEGLGGKYSVYILLTIIILDGNVEGVLSQVDSAHCGTTETDSE